METNHDAKGAVRKMVMAPWVLATFEATVAAGRPVGGAFDEMEPTMTRIVNTAILITMAAIMIGWLVVKGLANI